MNFFEYNCSRPQRLSSPTVFLWDENGKETITLQMFNKFYWIPTFAMRAPFELTPIFTRILPMIKKLKMFYNKLPKNSAHLQSACTDSRIARCVSC